METDNYTLWTGFIRPLKIIFMYLISNILYMFRLRKLPVTIGIYTGCFGNYNNSKLLIGIRKDLLNYIPESFTTYNNIHNKTHILFSIYTRYEFICYWDFIINSYDRMTMPFDYKFIHDQYKFVSVINFNYLKNDEIHNKEYYIDFCKVKYNEYSKAIEEYFESLYEIPTITMFERKDVL